MLTRGILKLMLEISFLLNFTAYAASSVGNGAGMVLTEQNPWFLGNTPVRYCIVIDRYSEPKRTVIQSVVVRALANWQETLVTLKSEPLHKSYLLSGNRNLALQFEYGDCNKTTELSFYMGVMPPEIKTAVEATGGQYVGFALRTEYNVDTGRGKGLVWIRGDRLAGIGQTSRSQLSLYNTVLHELGHVFGIAHRKSGVMAPESVYLLSAQPEFELSSGHLVALNWPEQGRFCGWLQSSSPTEILGLLGVDENERTQALTVCLSRVSTERSDFSLTVFTKERMLSKNIINIKKSWGVQQHDFISGHYKSAKEYLYNRIDPWTSHSFIKNESARYAGEVVLNQQTYVVILNNNVNEEMVEMSFVLPSSGTVLATNLVLSEGIAVD